jgi:hypothetical protein
MLKGFFNAGSSEWTSKIVCWEAQSERKWKLFEEEIQTTDKARISKWWSTYWEPVHVSSLTQHILGHFHEGMLPAVEQVKAMKNAKAFQW